MIFSRRVYYIISSTCLIRILYSFLSWIYQQKQDWGAAWRKKKQPEPLPKKQELEPQKIYGSFASCRRKYHKKIIHLLLFFLSKICSFYCIVLWMVLFFYISLKFYKRSLWEIFFCGKIVSKYGFCLELLVPAFQGCSVQYPPIFQTCLIHCIRGEEWKGRAQCCTRKRPPTNKQHDFLSETVYYVWKDKKSLTCMIWNGFQKKLSRFRFGFQSTVLSFLSYFSVLLTFLLLYIFLSSLFPLTPFFLIFLLKIPFSRFANITPLSNNRDESRLQ